MTLILHFAILFFNFGRPVALTARASDSKSEGWGFESLLACHFPFAGRAFETRTLSFSR